MGFDNSILSDSNTIFSFSLGYYNYTMKSNELRSGNIILENGKIIRVNGTVIKNLEQYELAERIFDEYQPVLITEDILRKCKQLRESYDEFGPTFHLMEDNGFVVKYTIHHYTKEDLKSFKNKFWFFREREVKYLHDLQNLFFAKEQIELEIDL